MASVTYAYGFTESEFVAKCGDRFSKGEQITIVVKVTGEPDSAHFPRVRN